MSTNAFTHDARAVAEERLPLPVDAEGDVYDEYDMHDFAVGMAVWAMDHTAQQEPTPEAVLAATVELVTRLAFTDPGRPWEDPEVLDEWEHVARSILRKAMEARA